ncbi:DUF2423 domain-containing protein [Aspergillus lucknowensis]|uniref:DUF2423 domain-containing protein n=1 Tax=Aspergillus lucknowensis TaxID=176173 RepID=A0ABR4LEL4_9EURO
MAKSVRASVSKRNKAKLRATVFGPAVDARTERLSAKLQELASQPKPSGQEKPRSNVESTDTYTQDEKAMTSPAGGSEAMDIDTSKTNSKGRSQRSGRIQKRHRKSRSSIVFKPHPSKTRKIPKKK